MSRIVITRKKEWNNRLREIGVYVDGKKLGTISNGETKTFDVPPGTHQLMAKIDWCRSKELPFLVSENEKKYFRLSGFKYSGIITPLVFGILILHILIKRFTGFEHLIWLAFLAFLPVLYYITIGHNDYLRLREDESWEIS